MFNLSYDQQKTLFKDTPLPFCFLDLERLDQNIQQVLKRAGNKEIRVASKSVRSVPVMKYIADKLGDKFSGLMTFKISESIDLLEQGFDHCLMGYPESVSREQTLKLKELARNGKKLVMMADSIEQLKQLEILGEKHDFVFSVCLDIDLSLDLSVLNFGVFRSPLHRKEHFKDLINFFRGSSFIKCEGLMGYEAQIAGVQDRTGKGFLFDWIVRWLKQRSKKNINPAREEVAAELKKHFDLSLVNGGGTGSIEYTRLDNSVTEITVGSGFYCPHLFDEYDKPFLPSLGYAIEVVRRPRENYITCHGGGYVASGSLDRNKLPKVISPTGIVPEVNEMFGEVQTPFKTNRHFNLGDPVFVRHAKAGELLERFNSIQVVRDEKIMEEWKSYRGEGKCYL